jgi:hypothetical protein
MNGMDLEGSGRIAIRILAPHLLEGTEENLRIATVSTEIRTEHLPNTPPR